MKPNPRALVVDEQGRMISAGQYVGRVVQLKNRRWVHGRPGKPASASQYRDADTAARALVDAVVAETGALG
jgi:hypothetical protein